MKSYQLDSPDETTVDKINKMLEVQLTVSLLQSKHPSLLLEREMTRMLYVKTHLSHVL